MDEPKGAAGFVGYHRLMAKRGERSADRVSVTCPCGTAFEVTKSRYEAGRGRRCSKACQYAYATRPTGLSYSITRVNPTAFPKGHEPWNKGVAMKDEITYKELHRWVARHRTKTGRCEHCQEHRETQWANRSHEYRRELGDWLELCRSCHRKHDSGPAAGAATRKFGRDQVQNG